MSHTEKMREALRKVRPYLEDGANHGDDAVELLKLVDEALTAPAAEVPTDGWLQDGGLLYRLTDDRSPVNRDEINVTMADGSRSNEDRARRAAELLGLIRGGSQAAAEVPEAMGDEQAHALWKSAPDVPTYYAGWVRDKRIAVVKHVIAARDAQWQSTRLRGGVPDSLPSFDDDDAGRKAFVLGWNACRDQALTAAPQAPAAALDAGVVLVRRDLIRRAQQAINWHLEPNSPDEHEATMRELEAIGWPDAAMSAHPTKDTKQ